MEEFWTMINRMTVTSDWVAVHVKIWLFFCTMSVHGYGWGNFYTSQPPQFVTPAPYRDVILLPDPELPAPSDGYIRRLIFHSIVSEVSFSLAILEPLRHHEYRVRSVSEYIISPTATNANNTVHFSNNDLLVKSGDFVVFVIDSAGIPMSYTKKKGDCDPGRMINIKQYPREGMPVQVSTEDFLDLGRDPDENCWAFSYSLDVDETDHADVVTEAPPAVPETDDPTDWGVRQRPGLESDFGSDIDYTGLSESDLCDMGHTEHCDVRLASDSDSDMFRYVIFGPLIILWIIVSVVCSYKMKRKLSGCWGRGRQSVRPTSHDNHPPESIGPDQPRRTRFARVTLSRIPPTAVAGQPKALPPHMVLPPYSGPQYSPAAPPPAYTSLPDIKSQIEPEVMDNDVSAPQEGTVDPPQPEDGAEPLSESWNAVYSEPLT